ncbi:sensor domain-containing protein [Legionella impletisoli]|uniref:sensor domain-containing protein n=1 Tax=Legionella impletisoli TaxID=343510 RepID=UPI00166C674B|nr:GGDEF domain-containing phosphodiesterase [Legionella impletisoli]
MDTLFFYDELLASSQYPGRMAPNTSLLFILTGLILLGCNHKSWHLTQTIIIFQMGIILLFTSLLFNFGYVTTFETIYRWADFKAMAVHTAFGFVLIALSLISAIGYFSKVHKIKLAQAIPITVTIGIFLINGLLVLSIKEEALSNKVESNLANLLFFAGSIFSILFGLILFYAQKFNSLSRKEKELSTLLHETLEATEDGILATSKKGKILIYNQRFLTMWNVSEAQCKELNLYQLIDYLADKLNNPQSFKENIYADFANHHNHHESIASLKVDGFYQVSARHQLSNDQIVGYVLTFTDITQSKKLEQEIIHHKSHDALTGLANKMALIHGIQILVRHALVREKLVSVFLLDIGRFARINDTYGQTVGDLLLKNIALRITQEVPDAELIGRLVSDVFVVVFIVNNTNELETKANQLIALFTKPFYCQNTKLILTCSLGASLAPYDSKNPEELLRLADIALLQSKKIGANHYMRYKPQYGEYVKHLLQIENELHTALKNEEFVLYYQPIIELSTFKIIGVEALLRWYNPRLGLLLPDQFLEVANEVGLISDIGDWVLNRACSQIRSWENQGLEPIKLNVNVSSAQFKNCRIVGNVMSVLNKTQIHPHQLQIELLEQTLIDKSNEVVYCLSALQKKGVDVALDDFGTGYSNVNYLKNFPVDCIKIARPFIADIEKNFENKNLIISMIQMAESHHITTVAEGIETKEQLDFLREQHCQFGQGYYFSKPMTAEECFKFLSMKIYRPPT